MQCLIVEISQMPGAHTGRCLRRPGQLRAWRLLPSTLLVLYAARTLPCAARRCCWSLTTWGAGHRWLRQCCLLLPGDFLEGLQPLFAWRIGLSGAASSWKAHIGQSFHRTERCYLWLQQALRTGYNHRVRDGY